jgi:predicted regulator of Ras-like GTPase activity (Roadblock/LC7/MglB family)
MLTDSLISILDELNASLPGIEAIGAVSGKGFLAAPLFPEGLDKDRSSALCAAMLAWGEKTLREAGKGAVEQVLVKGSGGYVVISSAGTGTALVVMTQSDGGLEDIKRAADSIAALLR